MHAGMLNIPLAISMQMVNYNLPGLNSQHLKLSGPVLAGIYQGKIQKWNDRQIAAMNPGVKLPDHAIIPVHRSDGSGDTFIFTQYLSFSSPEWKNSLSYGTTVSWPAVSGGLGAVGNPGMLTAIKGNPYSIAYIGTSYQDAIQQNGLGIARLKNHDGNFVLPTEETAKAAAAVMVPKTPANERISLIFAPGAQSYPIINYEYAIVNRKQPNADVASTLRKFFHLGDQQERWQRAPFHAGSSLRGASRGSGQAQRSSNRADTVTPTCRTVQHMRVGNPIQAALSEPKRVERVGLRGFPT